MPTSLRRTTALSAVVGTAAAMAVLTGSTMAAAGPAPSAAPASAPYSDECLLGRVTVTGVDNGAAANTEGLIMVLRNTSSTPCLVSGYPTVQFTFSDGTTRYADPRLVGYQGGVENNGPIPLVTVQPGQTASATTEAGDEFSNIDPEVGCGDNYPTVAHITVTLPDDTRSTTLPFAPDYCAYPSVHPVVPGDTGFYDG